MREAKLTVGQLAQKFGISTKAVRHYEKIGLLESDREPNSNYRLYGEAEADRVYQILLLKSMGFTLREISAIITSNGCKKVIVQIIDNRLKALTKKSLLFSQCIELLNEFLSACSGQDDENIDSFGLLSELLAYKNREEPPEGQEESGEAKRRDCLLEDGDLEVLRHCMSEDLNPLYLPFVLGREDGDLLENFFVSHRRFWGFPQLLLTDGSNLDEVYNPATFRDTILRKMGEVAWDSSINRSEDGISYRHIVEDLCNILAGVEYEETDSLPVLERKLVSAVFFRALEMLELAGQLTEKNIKSIAQAIGNSPDITAKQELEEVVMHTARSGGIQAFRLARLVNEAIRRNRYSGPFYVLTEATAFSSGDWLLDRALDMAVGFLWTHEINPAGQPYYTLAPVIFHIAYIRTRVLFASTSHIQPEIVSLDEFMVIGLEMLTTDINGESFTRVPKFEEEEYVARRIGERIPNRVRPGIQYGMNCRRKGDYYSYIAGEQVSSLETVPEGMTGELVPAGVYAVFAVNGGPLPYKVVETIIYAYQHWLPASRYQWEDRPGFQLYINATGRSDSDIRIYIPVAEKGAGV